MELSQGKRIDQTQNFLKSGASHSLHFHFDSSLLPSGAVSIFHYMSRHGLLLEDTSFWGWWLSAFDRMRNWCSIHFGFYASAVPDFYHSFSSLDSEFELFDRCTAVSTRVSYSDQLFESTATAVQEEEELQQRNQKTNSDVNSTKTSSISLPWIHFISTGWSSLRLYFYRKSHETSESLSPPTSTDAHFTLPSPRRQMLRRRRHEMPSEMESPLKALQTPMVNPSLAPFSFKKKILVLDLDETLVHSTVNALHSNVLQPTMTVQITIGDRPNLYYVFKRPHCDTFLRTVSEWFHVCIFTASLSSYANPVLDHLSATCGVHLPPSRRFFREHCTVDYEGRLFQKNLGALMPTDRQAQERDDALKDMILVDNSLMSFGLQPLNGIHIQTWICDPQDECLLDLLPLLDSLRFVDDVRSILGLRVA